MRYCTQCQALRVEQRGVNECKRSTKFVSHKLHFTQRRKSHLCIERLETLQRCCGCDSVEGRIAVLEGGKSPQNCG